MAPGNFSVEWGDFFVDAPGTYYIARLTFPQGVFPEVLNNVPNPHVEYSAVSQIDPQALAVVPEIPEPHALPLFSLGAAALAARLRRHPSVTS